LKRASCGPSTPRSTLIQPSPQKKQAHGYDSDLSHGPLPLPSRSARPGPGGHDGRPQRQRLQQEKGSSLRQLARSCVCVETVLRSPHSHRQHPQQQRPTWRSAATTATAGPGLRRRRRCAAPCCWCGGRPTGLWPSFVVCRGVESPLSARPLAQAGPHASRARAVGHLLSAVGSRGIGEHNLIVSGVFDWIDCVLWV
jgi:hypothetical protein